jgi:hypothetical protein
MYLDGGTSVGLQHLARLTSSTGRKDEWDEWDEKECVNERNQSTNGRAEDQRAETERRRRSCRLNSALKTMPRGFQKANSSHKPTFVA